MESEEAAPLSKVQGNDEDLFEQLESYTWGTDIEFQRGLQAILGPNSSPDQAEQLTLRARCFYYSRCVPPEFFIHVLFIDIA